eukprot:5344711-Pleurochrysis_carterae.AAC.3
MSTFLPTCSVSSHSTRNWSAALSSARALTHARTRTHARTYAHTVRTHTEALAHTLVHKHTPARANTRVPALTLPTPASSAATIPAMASRRPSPPVELTNGSVKRLGT